MDNTKISRILKTLRPQSGMFKNISPKTNKIRRKKNI